MRRLKNNPQLNPTDEGPKEAHHAQELDSAQVLHRVLLAHVGYSIEDGTEQDQPVAQHDIIDCKEEERPSWTALHEIILIIYIETCRESSAQKNHEGATLCKELQSSNHLSGSGPVSQSQLYLSSDGGLGTS